MEPEMNSDFHLALATWGTRNATKRATARAAFPNDLFLREIIYFSLFQEMHGLYEPKSVTFLAYFLSLWRFLNAVSSCCRVTVPVVLSWRPVQSMDGSPASGQSER